MGVCIKPVLWRRKTSLCCVSYGVFWLFSFFLYVKVKKVQWILSLDHIVLCLDVIRMQRTIYFIFIHLAGLWSEWSVMSRRRVGWGTRRRRRTAVGGRRGMGASAPPPSCWPRRSASLRSRSRLSFLWIRIRIRARICERLWNPGMRYDK